MIEEKNRSRPIMKVFYVDQEELVRIQERMAEAQIDNFSAYMRLMATTGKILVNEFQELRELRIAINRIGVNVNQVAKRVNENTEAAMEDLAEVLELLETINQKTEEAIASILKKSN